MQEISTLPGRVRFRLPEIFNKEIANYIHVSLEKLVGVKYTKVNHHTSSVLIIYDANKLSKQNLEYRIRDIVKLKDKKTNLLQYEESYLTAINNLKKSKNRLFFYGVLYLLFKLKTSIFGRFSISRNVRLLIAASAITTIEGYPLLRRLFKGISSKTPIFSDILLKVTAMALIFLREDGTGCLLLCLKYMNDYLRYATEVEYLKLINQTILDNSYMVRTTTKEGLELFIPTSSLRIGDIINLNAGEFIPADGVILEGAAAFDEVFGTGQIIVKNKECNHKVFEGEKIISGSIRLEVMELPINIDNLNKSFEPLHLQERVVRYQETIGPISIVLAMFKYLTTGDFLSALSIMLLLCPTASELAVNAGMNSYIHLLGKHRIFLRNPNVIEKIANIEHMAFDKTGTITQIGCKTLSSELELPKDTVRAEAKALISSLKSLGIGNLSLLTGDNFNRATEIAKELDIKNIYSNCSRYDKGNVIQKIKVHGTVMMVGDGVNDLEAMKNADVSVGIMHECSDKVKLYSDCVLFDDDLLKLRDFIILSNKSEMAINSHFKFSKSYNIGFGLLAIFIPFNPYYAKTLNTLNSMLVMLLSKRIEYLKPTNFQNAINYNRTQVY